jgi:protein DGCR14
MATSGSSSVGILTTRSASQMTEQKKNDSELMPPPPSRPTAIRRPAVALPEDVYLNGISRIIARDFFPGIYQAQLTDEFLEAVAAEDHFWIKDIGHCLVQEMTPNRKLGGRGTGFDPLATPDGYNKTSPPRTLRDLDATSEPEIPELDLNMSLGAFQAKYTSEDNESFNALLDKQNLKNREKHAYLFNGRNQIPSARQIAHHERKMLKAETSSNELEVYRRDSRPAMANYAKSAPRNSLMFNPESVENIVTTVAQKAEAKSNAPPKAIAYGNTRMVAPVSDVANLIPGSPSISAIGDAIAGQARLSESEAGWETPQVAGYRFIDAEPTASELRASENGNFDHIALLTHLTKSGSTPNPFTIKDAKKREQVHHSLVEKNDKKRVQGSMAHILHGKTPTATPKFMSAPRKAPGSLTPAGKSLLDKINRPQMHSKMADLSLGVSSAAMTESGRPAKKPRWTPAANPKNKV